MAIPSNPINRLMSPRWRMTFRGDGQLSCHLIINIGIGYEMTNINAINECVLK